MIEINFCLCVIGPTHSAFVPDKGRNQSSACFME